MISSPKVSPPVPMIPTQALEPYEHTTSFKVRQNGDVAMLAYPCTSPAAPPASSALRFAPPTATPFRRLALILTSCWARCPW
jgi:hypothetical protein